jgi:hypothetical protein
MKAACEICSKVIDLQEGYLSAVDAYDYSTGDFGKPDHGLNAMSIGDLLKLDFPEHREPSPESKNTVWKFTCQRCEPQRAYEFRAECFFKSPEKTLDWLAHLTEKVWFDGHQFCRFMCRLRDNIYEHSGDGGEGWAEGTSGTGSLPCCREDRQPGKSASDSGSVQVMFRDLDETQASPKRKRGLGGQRGDVSDAIECF